MTNYTDIIDRIEKLNGPDLYEDFLIHITLRGWRNLGGGRCEVVATKEIVETPFYSPPYTGSIDAALTLVPEGWQFQISNRARAPHGGRAYLNNRQLICIGGGLTPNPKYRGAEETAVTPAIALCIAALKARAAIAGEGKAGA